MDNKPLSQKPLGYILAILGGTLGGPIGWITSPLVLLVLNNIMKRDGNNEPNRFLVWGAIGIIGAPLSLGPIFILSAPPSIGTNESISQTQGSSKPEPSQKQETRKRTSTGVNMENFLRIKEGMTYQEVVSILGKEGEEMSRTDLGGISTVMYSWSAGGFSVGNMNAMFQNGALVSKAQFGLK